MLRSKYKEALSIGQEAVQVFVKTGHKRNQAGRLRRKDSPNPGTEWETGS